MPAHLAAAMTRARQAAGAVRKLGPPQRPPSQHWPDVTQHVDRAFGHRIRKFSRATITGAGTLPGTVRIQFAGDASPDSRDVPILVAYTSATLGAVGGPAVGDDLHLIDIGEGVAPLTVGIAKGVHA